MQKEEFKMKFRQTTYGIKKCLLGFLIFLFFLFLFDRGLFYIIQSIENNYYKRKNFKKIFWQRKDFNKNFMKLPKNTYSTLIMGSSRTYRGIHPYYIHKRLKQNAFKIAKAKIGVKFNYYFYKEYKKYAGVPRVIIYGVDYFIFTKRSAENFLRFIGVEDIRKNNYKNGALLLLSNKEKIDTFFNNMLDTLNQVYTSNVDAHGSKEIQIIDPFTGYDGGKILNKHKPPRFNTFYYTHYPGEEGIYFTKLLKECEADGVQVILVLLPDYIGTYTSNFQEKAFKKDIQRLTRFYKKVFIYDYNDPKVFPLQNTGYFLDGGYGKTNSHLSRKGARLFNRMLVKDLKKHYRYLVRVAHN
jgi:hypothetical protein